MERVGMPGSAWRRVSARRLCRRNVHLVATAPACGTVRTALGLWDVAPFWSWGGDGGGRRGPGR